ncbi:caspase family protein [Streptomyces sp. NPDC050095]|uniref:caspase family protein n=1 Tax=unclassified Streptomyces TaxID=2593676 RepID=UPI003412B4DE
MSAGGGRYALIVATDRYDDSGLSLLRAPTQDAGELAEVLADPAIGGFEVEVLDNPHSYDLRLRVEDFFADRTFRDTLLLHFACHGLKDSGNHLFLAATDTRHHRLASTAVPAEYVSGLMMSSRAQRVALFLDCCYAGAFERGMFSRGDGEAHVQDSFTGLRGTGHERGRAVLTASSSVEYAFEGDEVVAGRDARVPPGGRPGPSLFTGALVEGLRTGGADLDGDGEIGLRELAEYIGDRIRRVTDKQNPQLWMFGAQGDLPIARAPRRAVRTGVLPEALSAAAASAERAHRLWSVTDLASILHGPDVPLAQAACATLVTLAGDDSRRVAEAARTALASAGPQVGGAALHLGTTTAGVRGPAVLLPVGGPPVVRGTLEAVTEPWLRVRYVPEGVSLSVDSPAVGPHSGTVWLRCVTGSLAVRVTAQVTAARRAPDGPPPRRPERNQRVRERPVRERELTPRPLGRLAAPLTICAALMALTLILPSFGYQEDWDSPKVTTQHPFSGYAVIIGVQGMLGLVSSGLLALAARAGHRLVRHRGARLPYELIAAMGLLYCGGLGAIIADESDYELRPGYPVWAAAVLVQLWCVVALWRVRNRRRKRSAT